MLEILFEPYRYSKSYYEKHANYNDWNNQNNTIRDLRGRPTIWANGKRIKITPLGSLDKAFDITNISWLIECENVITGEIIKLRCGSKFGEDTLKSNLPKAVKFI
jgi:hypothetical protein